MKILLVNSPIDDYSHHKPQDYETVVPMGLGYLGTIIEQQGHNVSILDSEVQRLTIDEIRSKINMYNPDMLGINVPMPDLDLVKRILEGVNPSIYKVIGGTQVTLEPSRTFSYLNPDAMVVGEGEESFKYLVENLNNNKLSRNPFQGLYLKGYEEENFERSNLIYNLDDYPFINRELFENDPYPTEVGLESTILGSRGCPYSCIFCSVPVVSGKKLRTRSIENILDEMKYLRDRFQVNSVRFIDDNFTANKRRVIEFSEKLIDSGLNMKWRALSRIEAIKPEIIEKMAESGCYKLAFGIESFDPLIQDLIYKKIDFNEIKENLELCRKLGIKTKGFFTLGYPNETQEMIETTIRLSQEVALDDVNYNIVRAFEGTRLKELALKKGFTTTDLNSFVQFESLNNLEGLSGETIRKAKELSDFGFNVNKYLKYHFSNGVILNNMNIFDLDKMIRKAYIDFYYNKYIYGRRERN